MTRRLSIAIFTGSRAWDVAEHWKALGWCRRQVAAVLGGSLGAVPDVVAHGDAPGLDRYVEDIARYCLVPRVVFPLPPKRGEVRGPETRKGEKWVCPTVGWALFTYSGPLDRAEDGIVGRNGAMMRWGRAQADAGHDVTVIALRAPWSLSGGTVDAIRHATACELLVVEPKLPPEFLDTDDGTTSGGST